MKGEGGAGMCLYVCVCLCACMCLKKCVYMAGRVQWFLVGTVSDPYRKKPNNNDDNSNNNSGNDQYKR